MRRGPGKAGLWILGLIVSFSSIGVVLYSSADEGNAEALHVSQPLTPIESLTVGAPVRLEGKVMGENGELARLEDTPCVARQTTARLLKADADTPPEFIERKGPQVLQLQVGETTASVKLADWKPQVWAKKAHVDTPPAWTALTAAPDAEYELAEHTLHSGDSVFIVGKVASLNPLVLEADPELARVEVFRGPQGALKSALLGRDMVLRVTAFALWGLSVFLVGLFWMLLRFGRSREPVSAS